MDIMDLLQSQISGGLVEQLANQVGGDREQVSKATDGILHTLVGALAKNTASNDGASMLANVLDRDHDGSILDDAMGFLSGQKQPANPRMTNGSGIVKHLLGDNQSGALDMISKLSGLDSGKAGNLMSMLAPIVMGALGKHKRQSGLDASGIASLLTNTVNTHKEQSPSPIMNMVTGFLDADGDGSIVDDLLAKGAKGFLRNLFK